MSHRREEFVRRSTCEPNQPAAAVASQSSGRGSQAQEPGGVGLLDRELDSGRVFWSEQHFRVWGLNSARVEPSFDSFLPALAPADREPTAARMKAVRPDRSQSSYEAEFRLPRPMARRASCWRTARSCTTRRRARRSALPVACLDVTERCLPEDRLRLLAREVDDRARNPLAVDQAAVRLVPTEDAGASARAVDERMRSLDRLALG